MSSKYYRTCAVPLCTNTTIKTPEKLFIFLPYDKTIRNKWLKMARRDLQGILPKTQLYFCEDHFDLPNDMENYMQYHLMGTVSQIRMKPSCIPSKFDCQPDRRKQTADTTERHYIVKKENKELIKGLEKEIENRTNIKHGETSPGSLLENVAEHALGVVLVASTGSCNAAIVTLDEHETTNKCIQPEISTHMSRVCEACEIRATSDEQFASHLRLRHCDEADTYYFVDDDEFDDWLSDMQQQTKCNYKKINEYLQVCENETQLNSQEAVVCPSAVESVPMAEGFSVYFYKKHCHSENVTEYNTNNRFKSYRTSRFLDNTEQDLHVKLRVLIKKIVEDASKLDMNIMEVVFSKLLAVERLIQDHQPNLRIASSETIKSTKTKQEAKLKTLLCKQEASLNKPKPGRPKKNKGKRKKTVTKTKQRGQNKKHKTEKIVDDEETDSATSMDFDGITENVNDMDNVGKTTNANEIDYVEVKMEPFDDKFECVDVKLESNEFDIYEEKIDSADEIYSVNVKTESDMDIVDNVNSVTGENLQIRGQSLELKVNKVVSGSPKVASVSPKVASDPKVVSMVENVNSMVAKVNSIVSKKKKIIEKPKIIRSKVKGKKIYNTNPKVSKLKRGNCIGLKVNMDPKTTSIDSKANSMDSKANSTNPKGSVSNPETFNDTFQSFITQMRYSDCSTSDPEKKNL